MSGVPLSFVVEDDQVLAQLRRVAEGVPDLVKFLADDLADYAAAEARGASSRLGAPWQVTVVGEVGHVVAPEWWAHFVAGGTRAHGPRKAEKLVFEVDGETVFADWVEGMPSDPFDKRAIAKTETHVDDIMKRIIAEAT